MTLSLSKHTECKGGEGTSTPELQEHHGPHSTKAVPSEASVCALGYLVTHCHSNDRHHKHYDTFLLIGNVTRGAQSTEATEWSQACSIIHPQPIESASRRRQAALQKPGPAGEAGDLAASTCGGGVRRCRDPAPSRPAGAFSSSSGNICM